MSSFNSFSDAAFQIRTEGQNIKLEFQQGVPTNGQGTLEWNIPEPAHGCNSGERGAYAGMVFVLRNEPIEASEIPQNGQTYVADNTADPDKFAGDFIGKGRVVGAIYECDKKFDDDQQFTTSLIITDLQPKESYYIAGYAVDCQFRHHTDGQRAYSDYYGETDKTSSTGINQVVLDTGDEKTQVLLSDGTGLTPGINYEFDFVVDCNFPNGDEFHTIPINIDGLDAGTYGQLIDNINGQILLALNPPQSPVPPNTGQYYWNEEEQQLYLFDGYIHQPIDSLNELTDPAFVEMGTYWHNTDTEILQRWNIPSPQGWNDIPFIRFNHTPNDPETGDYWFNQTIARQWNGAVWCDKDTFISPTDPSFCPEMEGDAYWFDESNDKLYQWSEIEKRWVEVTALYWPEDPNHLSAGTYWFDLTTEHLNIRSSVDWTDITDDPTTFIQEDEPMVSTSTGSAWYKPTTETLKIWSSATQEWEERDIIVWPDDPTDTQSCDLWWRSTDEKLFSWDTINNEWKELTNFTISPNDPTLPKPLEVYSVWYNPNTAELKYWDGGDWILTDYIDYPTDPTIIVPNSGWYKFDTNQWFIWNTPVVNQWNEINPIDSPFDPNIVPNGTHWMDTDDNALSVRNGMSWIPVMYSATPLTPDRNQKWYDSKTKSLYYWDGENWVTQEPIGKAILNTDGNVIFSTTCRGSGSIAFVPTPDQTYKSQICRSTGTGKADLGYGPGGYGYTGCAQAETLQAAREYPTREISAEDFLWNNVTPKGQVLYPDEGIDGVSGISSYDQIGVGTDGTPDERRELADSIRQQLGYPVVDVELTKYQLDTAIQGAIESFRKRSGGAYKRGFFMLDLKPGQSHYQLTNKRIGYNKIVDISAVYRFNSAFLTTAQGAGAYGQIVLQHMYNMGTYDLTSFFLVSQYIEQLEDLFATRLVFTWGEQERLLHLHQAFRYPERVLMDVSIERTEQELFKDRYVKSWIERFALGEACQTLAHIRGKYATLPGAGGGVALNAADLQHLADTYRQECMEQLDDHLVDSIEDFGIGSTFILG